MTRSLWASGSAASVSFHRRERERESLFRFPLKRWDDLDLLTSPLASSFSLSPLSTTTTATTTTAATTAASMLVSVQLEQEDLLAAARRERGRHEQQQQQGQQRQIQQLLLPQPPPQWQQGQQLQQQQQIVQLNLDPAFLAKCRSSRGPLLRAMIQEHTRRGLT